MIRKGPGRVLGAAAAVVLAEAAAAGIIVNYSVDAGGSNPAGPEGLSARAAFDVSGRTLTILLENTSSGLPADGEVSDSLLVSIAFDLGSVRIAAGDGAVIGPGSAGLGAWASRGPGDSVGEAWLWTNDGGGDVLATYDQVISTSMGMGCGATVSFEGEPRPKVSGPFGGIAPDPLLRGVPGSKAAVGDSILFTLTLDAALTTRELASVARSSVVEFGSDYQYLAVPAPGAALLLLAAGARRRRRRGSRSTYRP